MKSLHYSVLLFLILLFSSTVFSQINDITRLPAQNQSHIIKESVPLWITENEMMIFYVSTGNDTIYSTKSSDRGLNWGRPTVMQLTELLNYQEKIYLTALRSNSGRIVLAWSIRGDSMKLTFSDDNGETWSIPISILGGSSVPGISKNSEYLNLTQLETGQLVLSFTSGSIWAYYKMSSDDGITWSTDAYSFPGVIQNKPVRELSFHSIGADSLLSVFHLANGGGIHERISTDGGITWGNAISIVNGGLNATRPRLYKSESDMLWLVYQLENETGYENFKQGDIYVLKSSDSGNSWIEEERFTKYVGNDKFINISGKGNKILLSFASERFTNYYQVSFAIIGETEEVSTPPKILSILDTYSDFTERIFIMNATVIDDEKVEKVEISFEENDFTELFDDGLHDDQDSADNIYGNRFDFIEPRNADQFTMTVNNILLPFSNKGILADINSRVDAPAKLHTYDINNYSMSGNDTVTYFYGSGARFEEGTFLFSGGFAISGYSNGEMWSNGVMPSTLVEDYLPGEAGSDPESSLNIIYSVYNDDAPFGSSWQSWRDAVSLGAEFYDGDNDGIYNPLDKNWNGTWDENEDMPLMLGDVTTFCAYNDGIPSNLRRWNTVEPQGIEIRQTIFASSLADLENVIFIKYSILNTGSIVDVMDSVYFGIWEDADLGDHTDDVVGCDTAYQSMFTYNNDIDDIYGENCPAFFTTYLQGPIVQTNDVMDTAKTNYGELLGSNFIEGATNLDISSHVFWIGGDPNLNEPSDKFEARNYLQGKDRVGEYPDPCNFPYCEVRGEVNCSDVDFHFWASGDPVEDIGWLSRMNVDQRNGLNYGPFKLEKDRPQEIFFAYVIGRGTDYFNSITVARQIAVRVIQEYESNFASLTYSPPPAVNPVNSYVLYQNYPNPFNPTTTIRYELPQDGIVTIDIYDILGQKVKTILNEFKQASRYEINFNAAGLASGVYIYRMKVNDFITSKKMILIR